MIALIIFSLTFAGITMPKVPLLRLDRPTIAFLGAIAMIAFVVLTFTEAVALVDWNTIALLLGMLIIIGALQLDGYTQALASAIFRPAKTGQVPLVVTMVSSWCFEIPLAIFLTARIPLGILGIPVASIGGFTRRGIVYGIYYFNGRWLRVRGRLGHPRRGRPSLPARRPAEELPCARIQRPW